MKLKDGRIVEASERELRKLYFELGVDDIYPFTSYLSEMKRRGVTVIPEQHHTTEKKGE